LFQAAALRRFCVVIAADQHGRPHARDVLFPSVGARSRAAAGVRLIRENALSSLPEPASNGIASRAVAEGISLGPHRSRLSEWSAVMHAEMTVATISRPPGAVSV